MSQEGRRINRDSGLTDEERAEERAMERRRRSEGFSRESGQGEHGIYTEPTDTEPMGHDDAWSEQHDEETRKRAEAQRKQWHEASITEEEPTPAERQAEDRARGRGGEGPLESGA
jgi:hypothetical protein